MELIVAHIAKEIKAEKVCRGWKELMEDGE